MVILTIIMIIAAIAAPGMMRGMAINRAQRGTSALARLGRRARTDSITFGRAHALVFRPGRAGTGRYELWRGLTDGCRSNPWATLTTATGCDTMDPDCADFFDAANYSSPNHTIRIATPVPATRMCFEPDGTMYTDNGSGNFVVAGNTVAITINRFDDGVAGGATPVEARTVLFPPLQAARLQ